jgi:hypothetical protein
MSVKLDRATRFTFIRSMVYSDQARPGFVHRLLAISSWASMFMSSSEQIVCVTLKLHQAMRERKTIAFDAKDLGLQ